MVDFQRGGDFSVLEDELSDMYFHPPGTGDLLLGDIAISIQKIRSQAEAYGHSLERELAFLVAHSMFHLMGYDHVDDREREIMRKESRERFWTTWELSADVGWIQSVVLEMSIRGLGQRLWCPQIRKEGMNYEKEKHQYSSCRTDDRSLRGWMWKEK